ncbi:MAG: hypothetical protein IPJ00_08240 [Saprospirales bacterium]|nr:hypothetical protein [Saprospirales bacterium]
MNHRQSSSRFKTRQQIALEFDFSYLTLWRELKDYEIEPPKDSLLSPNGKRSFMKNWDTRLVYSERTLSQKGASVGM